MTVPTSSRASHLCVHSALSIAIDLPGARLFWFSSSDAVQHVGVDLVAGAFLSHIHLFPDVVAFFYSSHLSFFLVVSIVEWLRGFGRCCGRGVWKLRARRAGRCGIVVFYNNNSSSSSNSGVGVGVGIGVGGSGSRCSSGGSLRLVEIVEETLLDAGRVGVVLVEEGLIDEVLAEPLERVFGAGRGQMGLVRALLEGREGEGRRSCMYTERERERERERLTQRRTRP
jgi:hypothetical protein